MAKPYVTIDIDMGIVHGKLTSVHYSTNGGKTWRVLIDNVAAAAIQKTWQDMNPALVAAYLYAFRMTS